MLITNGKEEKNVTKGVYNQLYKALGYHPVTLVAYEEPQIETIEEPKEKIVEEIKPEPIEEPKVEKIEKKEKTVSRKNTPKKSKK